MVNLPFDNLPSILYSKLYGNMLHISLHINADNKLYT